MASDIKQTMISRFNIISLLSKFIFVFLFLLSGISFSHAQTSSKDDLEKKKEQLVREISDMQKELDKTKKNKNANPQPADGTEEKNYSARKADQQLHMRKSTGSTKTSVRK
jgi:hypothetical protein